MAAHRSSRTDIPEPKSEVGLAEWTSKIKALQRQVDADEEAEQIRLEEEIAASRLARIRRSQGLGYSSRTNSVNACKCPSLCSSTLTNDHAVPLGYFSPSQGLHSKIFPE